MWQGSSPMPPSYLNNNAGFFNFRLYEGQILQKGRLYNPANRSIFVRSDCRSLLTHHHNSAVIRKGEIGNGKRYLYLQEQHKCLHHNLSTRGTIWVLPRIRRCCMWNNNLSRVLLLHLYENEGICKEILPKQLFEMVCRFRTGRA